MIWTVEYLASISKDVKKLDAQTRLGIRNFIKAKLAKSKNPRELGRALKGSELAVMAL